MTTEERVGGCLGILIGTLLVSWLLSVLWNAAIVPWLEVTRVEFGTAILIIMMLFFGGRQK